MITPRRTRLVRVPELHDFRRVIRALAGPGALQGPPHSAARLVIVPTRVSGTLLGDLDAQIVTREGMYEEFHLRLPGARRRLTPFERDSMAQGAAQEARAAVPGVALQIRPGLVAELLRFYDELRRQSQSVERFEQLLSDTLERPGDTDRGAERLLQQTRFLAAAFRGYERRLLATNAYDEHALRSLLLTAALEPPVRRLVITVPDWIADTSGLFVADFDLLSRMPGIESIDIVCTEGVLASGFHERLDRWWPGIEEARGADLIEAGQRVRPVLLTPPDVPGDVQWFTERDREEELASAAARILRDTSGAKERCAIVFKRPLPYLYLAPDTLGAVGLAYQIHDELPLAAEPVVSSVDLVLDAAESGFSRTAVVALLRSPHLRGAGQPPAVAVSALDRALSEARYLGDVNRLEALGVLWRAAEATGLQRDALPALDAAIVVARQLAPLMDPAPASSQLRRVLGFLAERWTPLTDTVPFAARERRAREAIAGLLIGLAGAHEAHHDPQWSLHDLATTIRRWVGEHTFAPERSTAGVHLVDEQAARYGEFDDVTIVGLVDNEWPERPRRNIFYSPGLLRALGWPSEAERRAASDARFLELVASATRRVALSTFILDDESLVMRSMQLDEVPRARLSAVSAERMPAGKTAPLTREGDVPAQTAWARARHAAPAADAPEFHGFAGPQDRRAWSVSALETYLDCPFKFFAQHLLRLEEEPDDEEVMDPRRQGQFVHHVFEMFFSDWQASGRGAVTPGNLAEAREMFRAVVDRELTRTHDVAEAALERTRLLGSSAAAGLGDAVLRMEAERPVPVVERLLEQRLEGELEIVTDTGPRVVALRGKADRLDLLADGTFRLIDYKLGWPPERTRALQLPIYGLAARQFLARQRGRPYGLGEAMYLAFKGPKRVVPLFTSTSQRDDVLAKAQQRLADALDGIERGEFPPTPDDVYRCETCSFAAVCRKDYVGDV